MISCAMIAVAALGVAADPNVVVITAPDQEVYVELTHEGEPLPAKSFKGYSFLAGPHDYAHMIALEAVDGGVTFRPTKTCEMGTYDLVIDTRAGAARIDVRTPLSDMPDTLENQAKALGIPLMELKEKMGLVTYLPRDVLSLNVPEVAYVGQPLPLALYSAKHRAYTWAVNGKIVQDGQYEMTFNHIFDTPGDYLITYREREMHNGATVTAASATVKVVEFPPIPWEVPANVEVTLPGVADYKKHDWLVDGKYVGESPELKYTFTERGNHGITVRASDAKYGPRDSFMRLHYTVKVK